METRIVEDYMRRSGDSGLPDGTLEENEHGFCVWRTHNNELTLVAVYGDGAYWNNWATEKAMKEGYKNIYFATRRNPEGFIRKHGFKVVGHILARTV